MWANEKCWQLSFQSVSSCVHQVQRSSPILQVHRSIPLTRCLSPVQVWFQTGLLKLLAQFDFVSSSQIYDFMHPETNIGILGKSPAKRSLFTFCCSVGRGDAYYTNKQEKKKVNFQSATISENIWTEVFCVSCPTRLIAEGFPPTLTLPQQFVEPRLHCTTQNSFKSTELSHAGT